MKIVHFSMKGKSGVYQIRNLINNKVYVGRTKSFYHRSSQYVSDFKTLNSSRLNNYFVNAIKKYGPNNFMFEILEECDVKFTPERELYWIHKLNSTDRKLGYNLRLDVNGNMVVSPETSKKISDRLKEEWKRGLRSNHSSLLKKSWSQRNRADQSSLMTKNLTKWGYLVEGKLLDFKELKSLNLSSVQSKFHKYKTDKVKFKNLEIERIRL